MSKFQKLRTVGFKLAHFAASIERRQADQDPFSAYTMHYRFLHNESAQYLKCQNFRNGEPSASNSRTLPHRLSDVKRTKIPFPLPRWIIVFCTMNQRNILNVKISETANRRLQTRALCRID